MYETDCVSSAPRYVREKGMSKLMVIFTDRKRSSSLFTLSSVKGYFIGCGCDRHHFVRIR